MRWLSSLVAVVLACVVHAESDYHSGQTKPPDASVTTVKLADGAVTNAKVASDAAIAGSKLQALSVGANAGVIPSTGIVDAHVASGAAIAGSKLQALSVGANAGVIPSTGITSSHLAAAPNIPTLNGANAFTGASTHTATETFATVNLAKTAARATLTLTPSATAGDHTADGTYITYTVGSTAGMTATTTVVVVAGFTHADYNGTFRVYDVVDATHFRVSKVTAEACSVVGTITHAPRVEDSGGVAHWSQAAAPTGPLTGDTWTETDNGGMVWVYDSTVDSGTWLSQQVFERSFSLEAYGQLSGSDYQIRFEARPLGTAYDVYLQSLTGTLLNVGSSGANYYTVSLSRTTQQHATTLIASYQTAIPANAGNKRAVTGNVATMTTYTTHNFLVGDRVTVANCGDATYNGTYAVTAATALTFSFALTHGDEGETADAAVTFADEDTKWARHYLAVNTLIDVSVVDVHSFVLQLTETGNCGGYGAIRAQYKLAVPK